MTAAAASHFRPAQSTWTSTTASARASQSADQRTAGTMPGADGKGMGFMDFLGSLVDVINPLQHLPVVGALYRRVTGDEISGAARIAGGTLFGGPIGGAMAMADVAYAQENGTYAGDTMLARMMDDPAAPVAAPVMMAAAQSLPQAVPASSSVVLASAGEDAHFLVSSPSLSASPTPNRMRTANSETATSRVPDTPMTRQPQAEFVPATFRSTGDIATARRLTALASVDDPLSLPEAPAASRTDLPPELMAMKMMEGLDKYAAMKSRGL